MINIEIFSCGLAVIIVILFIWILGFDKYTFEDKIERYKGWMKQKA